MHAGRVEQDRATGGAVCIWRRSASAPDELGHGLRRDQPAASAASSTMVPLGSLRATQGSRLQRARSAWVRFSKFSAPQAKASPIAFRMSAGVCGRAPDRDWRRRHHDDRRGGDLGRRRRVRHFRLDQPDRRRLARRQRGEIQDGLDRPAARVDRLRRDTGPARTADRSRTWISAHQHPGDGARGSAGGALPRSTSARAGSRKRPRRDRSKAILSWRPGLQSWPVRHHTASAGAATNRNRVSQKANRAMHNACMDIYLINLARRPDRLAAMAAQARPAGPGA